MNDLLSPTHKPRLGEVEFIENSFVVEKAEEKA
jgi:hypothetical protein